MKVVPEDIKLTPRALAYWYMDDGSKKEKARAYVLCTDSFTIEGLDILRKEIHKNWGIMVNYHKTEKGNLRLYKPVKYRKIFEDLIKEYLLESMERK